MKTTLVKRKRFDCVEMMHRAQERIRRELEGKTIREELAYWRGSAERLRAQLERDAQARRKRARRGRPRAGHGMAPMR
jgi:hypothetical protein